MGRRPRAYRASVVGNVFEREVQIVFSLPRESCFCLNETHLVRRLGRLYDWEVEQLFKLFPLSGRIATR